MQKVYLDVNVVFDFLLRRKPFYLEAAQIIELAKLNEITLVTDTQTLVFVFFHMVKVESDRRKVKDNISALLQYLDVVPLSKAALQKALAVDNPTDLEDAAQLEIAQEIGAHVFVTRDVEVYKKSSFPIKSPAQFLLDYSQQ